MDCDTGKYTRRDGGARHGEEKRPVTARSTFMDTDEIERERLQSGWNPYAGEEEDSEPYTWRDAEADPEPYAGQDAGVGSEPCVGQGNGKDRGMYAGQDAGPSSESYAGQDAGPSSEPYAGQDAGVGSGVLPVLMMPGDAQVMEELQEAERDLRKMQSMYPAAAKAMLPVVEEECDRMEYDGSPMYDDYPDQTTIYCIVERICQQVPEQLPEDAWRPEELADVLSMQYRGPGAGRPGGSRPGDNRPGGPGNNRPGDNRPGGPGSSRPGDNRPGGGPGGRRPGDNRPSRPGGSRPGSNRPGSGGPGNNRPESNRPGSSGNNRPDDNRPGKGWMGDLARVLLLHEMHHRRDRRRARGGM